MTATRHENATPTDTEVKAAIQRVLDYLDHEFSSYQEGFANSIQHDDDRDRGPHIAISLEVLARYLGTNTDGWLTQVGR
jgi:uncharacterized protein YyaL (SSP411 family)